MAPDRTQAEASPPPSTAFASKGSSFVSRREARAFGSRVDHALSDMRKADRARRELLEEIDRRHSQQIEELLERIAHLEKPWPTRFREWVRGLWGEG